MAAMAVNIGVAVDALRLDDHAPFASVVQEFSADGLAYAQGFRRGGRGNRPKPLAVEDADRPVFGGDGRDFCDLGFNAATTRKDMVRPRPGCMLGVAGKARRTGGCRGCRNEP
jgi:hypothetical protein